METIQNFFSINFASIIALIVATLSGVFTLVATRRSARPQMIQPYLQYLQKKMDILTEHICYKSKISSNFELTTEEGQKDAVKAIRDVYDYKESVIMNESNLFTECESQYRELLLEREAIDKSNSFQSLAIQFKDNPERVHFGELKDAPYQDFNSFISAMIRFSRETDNLMRAERAATLQQIKDLTLK